MYTTGQITPTPPTHPPPPTHTPTHTNRERDRERESERERERFLRASIPDIVLTLNIWTPRQLTIFCLAFEHSVLHLICLKAARRVANRVYPD